MLVLHPLDAWSAQFASDQTLSFKKQGAVASSYQLSPSLHKTSGSLYHSPKPHHHPPNATCKNRSPVCVKQPPVLLRQRSRPCVLIVKLVDIRSNRNSQSQLWTKHHWGRYPCRVCTLIIWMNNLSQFYNQHLSCWSRAVSSYYCNCLHSPVSSRSRPSPFNGQPDSVTTMGMLVS